MATEQPECCLGLNPDISGIGVRVALYVQILIGWIVSVVWPDEFAKNARTAYMTAIALIIAAFIQNRTQAPQDLSLLDAIVVSMITTMMITFAISSSPTRSETKKSKPDSSDNAAVNTAGNSGNDNNNDNDNNNNDNSTNDNQEEKPDPNASFSRFITQFAFVPLWAGWCFNLWQDPLHFGFKKTLPDCPVNESVTIVLFGRNIKATDERMRVAALVFVSVGVIIAFGSLFMSLEGLFKPFMRPLRVLLRVPIDQYITWHAKKWPEKKAGSHDELIMTFIRRGLQALSFATLIFLIVETELTIKRNDTLHATTQWSYGQTIAMILLLQQIMDVSSTSLEKCAERKEKKARKKKQQPQTTGTTSPVSMSTPAHGQAPGSVIPPSPKPSTIPPSPNSAIPSLPGGTANTPNQRA